MSMKIAKRVKSARTKGAERLLREPVLKNKEAGVVVVTVAILAVVLLLFLGLALDTALVRSRTSTLQLTADAAVLAAASGLPDLALAQTRAAEAVNRNSKDITTIVSLVPGKPGRVQVKLTGRTGSSFSRIIGVSGYTIDRYAYAEQSVGIAMGTPYNSIGTGDLLGTVPGNPTAKQGYFLAVNGPCTAKEDGDRFLALYEGTRGSTAGDTSDKNPNAYHCAEDDRLGFHWDQGTDSRYTGTPISQWNKNVENRPGGYSFIVDIPCNGGVIPCDPNSNLTDGVYIDAWDPWFRTWTGEPPCTAPNRTAGVTPDCVVDKVPISDPDRNWARNGMGAGFTSTQFAVYKQNADGTFASTPLWPVEQFGSDNATWISEDPTRKFSCAWGPGKWRAVRRSDRTSNRTVRIGLHCTTTPLQNPGNTVCR
jgi:hypothetical protein